MTPETQGFQLLWGLWWGLAERERPPHSRGVSPRAGAPRSPRGAAPHCTVTACLVLARQVNSIPPLLSPFFSFPSLRFLPPLSPPISLPAPLPPPPPFLFFHRPSSFLARTRRVFRVPSFDLVVSLLRRRRRVSQTSNRSPTVSLWCILLLTCGEIQFLHGGEFRRIFGQLEVVWEGEVKIGAAEKGGRGWESS